MTIKELRTILFNVDNQKMNVKELRKILFDYPDQNKEITPELLESITQKD